MGSPASPIVVEIVMQAIEGRAIATYHQTKLPIWLRYVDDTVTIVHQVEINTFHEHLNEQFTKEIEGNGNIPFLYCLAIRHKNKIRTTVYRKPTHTDRILEKSFYNPSSYKATTIE